MKPALQYIKDNWQKGDILYVHFYAQYAFDYYSMYHPQPFTFDDDEYIIGIAPRGWYRIWKRNLVSKYYDTGKTVKQSSTDILKRYKKDIDQLKGHKRAWLLFVRGISSTAGIKDSAFSLYYLDTKGKRLASFKNSVSAYLYDLSEQSTVPE